MLPVPAYPMVDEASLPPAPTDDPRRVAAFQTEAALGLTQIDVIAVDRPKDQSEQDHFLALVKKATSPENGHPPTVLSSVNFMSIGDETAYTIVSNYSDIESALYVCVPFEDRAAFAAITSGQSQKPEVGLAVLSTLRFFDC